MTLHKLLSTRIAAEGIHAIIRAKIKSRQKQAMLISLESKLLLQDKFYRK